MTGDQSIFSTLFASWRFEGFSISNLALRHFGLLESGFKDKLDKKLCTQDFDFILLEMILRDPCGYQLSLWQVRSRLPKCWEKADSIVMR